MQEYNKDVNSEYKRVESDFNRLSNIYSLNKKKTDEAEEEVKPIEVNNTDEFTLDMSKLDGNEDEVVSYRTVVKYTSVNGKSVAVAFTVFIILTGIIFCTLILPDIMYKDDYNRALTLYSQKQYTEAVKLFDELGGYRDSNEMLYRTKYEYGTLLYNSGNYREASEVFSDIINYENSADLRNESVYLYAGELYQNGQFDEANELYKTIIGYKDVEAILNDTVYEEAFNSFLAGNYEKAIQLFESLPDNKDAQQFVTISKAYLMDQERNAEPSSISSVMAALGAMDNDSARLALKLDVFKAEKLSGSWSSEDGMYKISLDRSKGELDIVLPMAEDGSTEFKIEYGTIFQKTSDGNWEKCLEIESFDPEDVSQPKSVVIYNYFDGQKYTLLKD